MLGFPLAAISESWSSDWKIVMTKFGVLLRDTANSLSLFSF